MGRFTRCRPDGARRVRLVALLRLQMFLFGTSLLGLVLLPAWRHGLIREGGALETVSAGLFGAAAITGIVCIVRSSIRSIADFAWPLLALIGLYDETSFAEQVLGLESPRIYGVKVDAFHDFLDVGRAVLKAQFHGEKILAGVFVILLALGICQAVFVLVWKHREACTRLVRSYPPIRFLACALVWLVPSFVVDLALVENTDLAIFIEELCETEAALALLFANLAIPQGEAPQVKSTGATTRPGPDRSPAPVGSAGSLRGWSADRRRG